MCKGDYIFYLGCGNFDLFIRYVSENVYNIEENWVIDLELEIIVIRSFGSKWYFLGKMYKVLGLVGEVRKYNFKGYLVGRGI